MLGWEFFITRGQNQQFVASWLAGVGGTRWLDDLVSKGSAKSLGGNGYPDKYEICGEVLSSVLANGVPEHDGALVIGDDYVQMPGHKTDVKIDMGVIRSLPPDEILTIEAWDQS